MLPGLQAHLSKHMASTSSSSSASIDMQHEVFTEIKDENGNVMQEADFISRPESGLCGLRNQGATCYLSSVIQTLYHTPDFRDQIFQWRYNPDTSGKEEFCVARQLQKLFSRMKCSVRGMIYVYIYSSTLITPGHQFDSLIESCSICL